MAETPSPGSTGVPAATRRGWTEGLDPKAIKQLENVKLRKGLSTEKAAQVALIEIGWPYWFRAVMIGLMRAAEGKGRASREMIMFHKALSEVGRLADPLKRLFEDLQVDGADDLRVMVDAYRQAERHETSDRLEMACQIIEAHIKQRPEDSEIIARRYGWTTGGPDAKPAAKVARG